MYCDFCNCSMCQNGCSDLVRYNGDEPVTRELGTFPVLHAQCDDGKWICSTCYCYELCIEAVGEPCSVACEHRPKIISEWTFWTYHLGLNGPDVRLT